MKSRWLWSSLAVAALFASTHAGNIYEGGGPLRSEASSSWGVRSEARELDVRELKLVTQLPAALPQRISSLAFDGEKIWVAIITGGGSTPRLTL